ncbi:MAG: PRC-barrel domain-containing protein [Patescibacteria group bacterium]|jgi:uncharacterized protein YrrD
MFIEASKLIGMPIASLETQSKIGTVREIIVDPKNGQLLGLMVQIGGVFSPKKVLSIIDITDWDPNGLVTNSDENLVDAAEVVRIKNLLDEKIILLGMNAKTESGQKLGIVENFLIDTNNTIVTKYYLKDILGNSKILTADRVSKIDKKIIFIDDVGEPPKGIVGAETA